MGTEPVQQSAKLTPLIVRQGTSATGVTHDGSLASARPVQSSELGNHRASDVGGDLTSGNGRQGEALGSS
ncbi:hypothetical protein GCM10023079_02840 [Streptomyces chitinivorans]